MDLDLAGKVIAITGGSRGFGRALAERLGREGATLALAARTAGDLAQAHAAVEAAGGQCLAWACDLADTGEAAAFVGTVLEVFGRLDALVCLAGMAPVAAPDIGDAMALGLGHVVEAAEAALPALAQTGGSLLICIAAHDPADPLAAARSAIATSLAAAHRTVRVNALALPAGVAEAEPLADLAAFLLSERAAAVRGAVIPASI